MAKGRKVGWSHPESGWFGESTQVTESTDGSELREEDVWSIIDDGVVDHDDLLVQGATTEWCSVGPESNVDSIIRDQRCVSTEAGGRVGGLSLAFDDAAAARRTSTARILHQFHTQESKPTAQRSGRHMAASAPVNVPNWTHISRVQSADSLNEWDDELENRDLERVPPHEYLAQEYARSHKMVATSVFEGVGRTLKGRDMSRVRDAVWSRTGFNG